MESSLPGLRYEIGSTVIPGDRLGSIGVATSGIGTYVKAEHIYASLVGTLEVVAAPAEATTARSSDKKAPKPRIEVQSSKPIASLQVLSVGQVALARVTRITVMQAFLEILATTSVTGESILLREPQQGIVRREDIRTGATEQVQVLESFLPGDLVICKVLALADQRRYLLTTAAPELGVIFAECRLSGQQMAPKSWKEMACPATGTTECRKCAKPRILKRKSDTHDSLEREL